jgi:hypothetical protein
VLGRVVVEREQLVEVAGDLRDCLGELRSVGGLERGDGVQTAWQILDAEGLPRLPRRDEGRRGPPARLGPVKAAALPRWAGGPLLLPCDHAGLLLLLPAMTDLGLPELISQAGYPSTRDLSSWQSIGMLLLAKCARKPRIHHAGALADDAGLATGEAGFNCDFHAIRHHGEQAVLEKLYMPHRS